MQCIVQGCERAEDRLGFCSAHYQQWYLYGRILPRPIRPMRRYNGATCGVPSCERTATDNGYCHTHYVRVRNHGDPLGHIPIKAFRRAVR